MTTMIGILRGQRVERVEPAIGFTRATAYPLREKWVGNVAAYNEARRGLHTRFVRSGYLMLQPTTKRGWGCIPT